MLVIHDAIKEEMAAFDWKDRIEHFFPHNFVKYLIGQLSLSIFSLNTIMAYEGEGNIRVNPRFANKGDEYFKKYIVHELIHMDDDQRYGFYTKIDISRRRAF